MPFRMYLVMLSPLSSHFYLDGDPTALCDNTCVMKEWRRDTTGLT